MVFLGVILFGINYNSMFTEMQKEKEKELIYHKKLKYLKQLKRVCGNGKGKDILNEIEVVLSN